MWRACCHRRRRQLCWSISGGINSFLPQHPQQQQIGTTTAAARTATTTRSSPSPAVLVNDCRLATVGSASVCGGGVAASTLFLRFFSSSAQSLRLDPTRRRRVEEEEEGNLGSDPLLPPLPTSSQPLGHPLPRDEHACSVSLPTWSSVVGYEEGLPQVTSAMQCGYPRFVYHPYIKQLCAEVVKRHGNSNNNSHSSSDRETTDATVTSDSAQEEECLVLPTKGAALRCQVFLQQAWEGRNPATLTDNALIHHHDDLSAASVVHNHHHPSRVRVVEVVPNLVFAVLFPAETQAAMAAKAYWQHTGEVVSSRRAHSALQALNVPVQRTVTEEQYVCHEAHLSQNDDGGNSKKNVNGQESSSNSADARGVMIQDQLRQRIASWAQVPDSPESVFLTPSGMGAMYLALRSARRRHMELQRQQQQQQQQQQQGNNNNNGGIAIVYGFPYLDTLKLCSRPELCPGGVEFFGRGNATDLANLQKFLATKPRGAVSVLFTEVPSNPLLQSPDLKQLRQLANEYNFVLAVDDTISNWFNVDLLSSSSSSTSPEFAADIVCTSLTKLVSGRGDAMAGSCVVNPHTAAGRWMQDDLQAQSLTDPQQSGLYCPDAVALWHNSRDFVQRSHVINQTAEAMADWLNDHADVERVYYPKQSSSVDLYHQVMRKQQQSDDDDNDHQHHHHPAGYGGLMSIVLHPHICQRTFYDALNVAKGPSLGTNFTLVCPYTLLAHYHELDFAMTHGVPPNLLRVAIGLEPLEELQQKFEDALAVSRLYPKIVGGGDCAPTTL